ncbi:hypothetical protein KJ764_05145 [Patescibacteria group bacterium]|nr:hypothetical protein [Patescibacteria group bacterium]
MSKLETRQDCVLFDKDKTIGESWSKGGGYYPGVVDFVKRLRAANFGTAAATWDYHVTRDLVDPSREFFHEYWGLDDFRNNEWYWDEESRELLNIPPGDIDGISREPSWRQVLPDWILEFEAEADRLNQEERRLRDAAFQASDREEKLRLRKLTTEAMDRVYEFLSDREKRAKINRIKDSAPFVNLETGQQVRRYTLRTSKDLHLVHLALISRFKSRINSVMVGDFFEEKWIRKSEMQTIPLLEAPDPQWAVRGNLEALLPILFDEKRMTWEVWDQLYEGGEVTDENKRLVKIGDIEYELELGEEGVRIFRERIYP